MFEFLRRKPKEQAIIALDIGTEIVKAALFTIEEKQSVSGEVIGKRAAVRGLGKIRQRLGDIQNGVVTDIASVVHNCQEAIRIASHEAGLKPNQMVMGIAGEFVKGATSNISYKREEQDAKINLSELRNIVHKLQWKAFGEVRKQLSEETGYPEIDVKLINTAIVDVRIDGYKVTNPLGFQGKEVQMSIFNSFAPLVHFSSLSSIADELDLDLLSIVSEPYALSRCIDFEDGNLSAIFIDVGGGTTDVAVVSNGCVIGTKMFALGGRTFTKRIGVELNISFQEAEKLKLAYTADKLEQKSKKIISDIISNDIEIWLEGINLSLSEFKNLEVLPSKILLCGGGTHLPEIKQALNNEKWYKKLHFARKPQATFIHPNDLGNIIDETKQIKDQQDITPMALVNVGIDLAGEETVIQKALRKVIGIMKV
ncbi:rod shape-determining protein [Patescibacteria group bacterium]|nr:rod shape-determining protein [Patescibacteria group bacterium]MBU1683643.1 rod shape-determining protein [Patescibacteria group bacterium]